MPQVNTWPDTFEIHPFTFWPSTHFVPVMDSFLPPGMDPSIIPLASPPQGATSNFNNPKSLEHTIIAVSAISSVITVVQLSTRVYGTSRITRSAGLDDCMTVIAFLFSMAFTGLVLSRREYARHQWDITLTDISISSKMILPEDILAPLALLLSKLSILLLLFRLFSVDRRTRNMIYIGAFWATVTSLTTVIVLGFQCSPRSGESFGSLVWRSRCQHGQLWAVIQGAMNATLDFYLLYLPIPMVWRLRLSVKRKVGVLSIFMTGLM